ncbi:SDR family NAD(P)-dependent oxidoreductase [Thiovibrio sp. JS02]
MQKNVLITGGNSGIGFAAAKLFKDKGYAVTITGRDSERLKRAASRLGADALIADLGKPGDLARAAEIFLAEGLDVLVNNGAIAKFQALDAFSAADFDEMFHVNVRGPLLLMQALLPALEKRGGGVVNVSSVIVEKAAPNTFLYAASKGAVDAFTRSLAKELAPRKIRVNGVAPGAIDTPIFSKTGLGAEALQAMRKKQENHIPLGRYGQPEEVARVIVAMAEATYVTGAIWRVDGGVTI